MVADEITLQKVSISRIKQEMRDVYYLSDDLVIASFDIHRDTLGNYPALIDGFSAIIMASGSAVVAIDTEEYEVVPDTIVFFSPDRVIRTVASTSDAAAYFVACSKSFINEIQIDLSASLPVYMRFGKQPCLRVTPQDTHEIRQVFQLIKTILASDKEHYRQEIIRCLFTAVFYIITELNMREQKNTVKLGRGEVIFEEFMELVRQYSKQERNVRFYARLPQHHPQIPFDRFQGRERQNRRPVDRRSGDPRGKKPAALFGHEHPGDRLSPQLLDPVVLRQIFQTTHGLQPVAVQAQGQLTDRGIPE